jgi:hypothetical protein
MVSLGAHSSVIDIGALMTFFSFLFFKRCILIDLHEYIRKDLKDLPYTAKDGFSRDIMKRIVDRITDNKKEELDEEKNDRIQYSRLDILGNVEPFIVEDEPDVVHDMYNRRMQYIAGNLIMGSFLMSKYNIKLFPLFMMIWVMNTFPL